MSLVNRQWMVVLAIAGMLCLSGTASLNAQGTNGALGAVVTDATGAIIPGAEIIIIDQSTQAQRTFTSDGNGRFLAAVLPAGRYTVTAALPGFKTAILRDVVVRVTEQTNVTITLEVGEISESVTVTAAADLLHREDAARGEVIEETRVKALPLANRNYTQLLSLIPGATAPAFNAQAAGESGNVNPNVNGLRAGSNNYLFDGGRSSNPLNEDAELLSTPSPDFIQEFKVQGSVFDAAYGSRAGSQVSIVTKSGGNDFHAEGWWFHRDNGLDARPSFLPDNPTSKQRVGGWNFGGPAIKDKLFFFGGTEHLRADSLGASAARTLIRVPTEERHVQCAHRGSADGATVLEQHHPGRARQSGRSKDSGSVHPVAQHVRSHSTHQFYFYRAAGGQG